MPVTFTLNGFEVSVDDVGADGGPLTLLDALRGELALTSAKDGCAPQGQCGCCTVLVDGRARVSCVTPVRRVAGRSVETVEGLAAEVAVAWADAFLDCGASQCGFCTPGIVMRMEDGRRRAGDRTGGGGAEPAGGVGPADPADGVRRALQAHLCRCTGWHGVVEASCAVISGTPTAASRPAAARDATSAARRATIESGGPQRVDRAVVLGAAGFAADTVPEGALVAVPEGALVAVPEGALVAVPEGGRGWVVAETLAEARRLSGKVQGRRTTAEPEPPLEVPDGRWAATLVTSWVEPAYLETDASWCEPGGEPVTPLANGGAFGAKLDSPVPAAARRLAGEHGRAVLAVWSREDVVRLGAKRPPVAGGMGPDGRGRLRVVRTPGIAEAVALAAPGLELEEVEVVGPRTSAAIRGAGWAEALCLCVAADAPSPLGGRDGGGVRVEAPDGGWALVSVVDGGLEVRVGPGDPLDEVVLRSYVEGACHMAAGWVASEALRVDPDGEVRDLTIRSFGILRPADTPPVTVVVDPEGSRGEPRAVGAAVFAAAAAAVWQHRGFAPRWPVGLPVL